MAGSIETGAPLIQLGNGESFEITFCSKIEHGQPSTKLNDCFDSEDCVSFGDQMSMNVWALLTAVIEMRLVTTLQAVTSAYATLASQEMVALAIVSSTSAEYLNKIIAPTVAFRCLL